MKQKMKIGLWVAFAAVAIGFTITIFNDLRNERLTVETEFLLKTTISSIDFESVPQDEALQTLRTDAIKANPEFAKVHFDFSLLKNSTWREEESPLITIKLVDVPAVESIRYTSAQGNVLFQIEGHTVYFVPLTGSGRNPTTTQKIRWWFYHTKASVSDFFGISDPIK